MHVRPNKSQNPAKSQNSSLSSAASTSNQFQSRPFEAQGETNTHSQESSQQNQTGDVEQVKSSGFSLRNIPIFAPGEAPHTLPRQFLIQRKPMGAPAKVDLTPSDSGNPLPEAVQQKMESSLGGEEVKHPKSSGFSLRNIPIFAPGEAPHTLPRQFLIQRKPMGAPAKVDLTPSDSGNPLPEAVQQKMEFSLGADFSNVRVHEGPQAKAIGALAFTQGNHLHFAPRQYNPNSSQGQELLGH